MANRFSAVLPAALLSLALIAAGAGVPAVATGHHRTYEDDDCRSIRHRDEAGFVWWEHRGTSHDDVCLGTNKMDIFWVRGGDDHIISLRGADQIHLGAGDDVADAGRGRDRIWGGTGHDEIHGGYGNDRGYDGKNEGGDTPEDADAFYGERGRDWADIHDYGPNDFFFGGPGEDFDPRYDDYLEGPDDCVDMEPPNDCGH